MKTRDNDMTSIHSCLKWLFGTGHTARHRGANLECVTQVPLWFPATRVAGSFRDSVIPLLDVRGLSDGSGHTTRTRVRAFKAVLASLSRTASKTSGNQSGTCFAPPHRTPINADHMRKSKMTEHTHSYTNFQMFVLVHHRFMVIIWLNCYHLSDSYTNYEQGRCVRTRSHSP